MNEGTPYIYYDGKKASGKVGRPRYGFWGTLDNRRATQDIERVLFGQYPNPQHGQEVLFSEQAKIAIKTELDFTDKEQIRNASYATLMQIMQFGTSENARLMAARELLDRIDGKAVQQVNQNVQGQVQQQVIVQVEYVKSRDGREIIDAQPIGGAALPVTGSKSDEGV